MILRDLDEVVSIEMFGDVSSSVELDDTLLRTRRRSVSRATTDLAAQHAWPALSPVPRPPKRKAPKQSDRSSWQSRTVVPQMAIGIAMAAAVATLGAGPTSAPGTTAGPSWPTTMVDAPTTSRKVDWTVPSPSLSSVELGRSFTLGLSTGTEGAIRVAPDTLGNDVQLDLSADISRGSLLSHPVILETLAHRLSHGALDPKERQRLIAAAEIAVIRDPWTRHRLSIGLWKQVSALEKSYDYSDRSALWSALRRYTSMLSPSKAPRFERLLSAHNQLDTRQVALQCVQQLCARGHTAGAQRHEALKRAVHEVALDMLKIQDSVRAPEEDSLLLNAIATSAALGDSRALDVARRIGNESIAVFGFQLATKLEALTRHWRTRGTPHGDLTLDMVTHAVQQLRMNSAQSAS